ncbi:MAG TPA: GIY-YIG nuclease family protein [Ohtaekwangia sp.]
MYYVYTISSIPRNYICVGLTDNLERRLQQHNSGWNPTTKPYLPFDLLLVECFPSRIAARYREKWLKTGVGKEYLKKLKCRKP